MFNKKFLIILSLFSLLSIAGGWALSAVKNQESRLIPLMNIFKNPVDLQPHREAEDTEFGFCNQHSKNYPFPWQYRAKIAKIKQEAPNIQLFLCSFVA